MNTKECANGNRISDDHQGERGAGRGVAAADVRGTRIAIANVGGTYYAFDDACTHEQCSLTEEEDLAGTTITCTCHGSQFDVRTGNVLAPRHGCRSRCTPSASRVTRCRSRCDGRSVCDCRR